jgi:hypothetical protein
MLEQAAEEADELGMTQLAAETTAALRKLDTKA